MIPLGAESLIIGSAVLIGIAIFQIIQTRKDALMPEPHESNYTETHQQEAERCIENTTSDFAHPLVSEVGVTAAAQAFYVWVVANAARLATNEVEQEFHQRLYVVRQRGTHRSEQNDIQFGILAKPMSSPLSKE